MQPSNKDIDAFIAMLKRAGVVLSDNQAIRLVPSHPIGTAITDEKLSALDPILREHYPNCEVRIRMIDGRPVAVLLVNAARPTYRAACDVDAKLLEMTFAGDTDAFDPVFDAIDAMLKRAGVPQAGWEPLYPEVKIKPIDPLDVEYDGVKLRTLIDGDAFNRQERGRGVWKAKAMTSVQRSAVSAHWSAQLRAKIAASKAADVAQVQMPLDAEDCEW